MTAALVAGAAVVAGPGPVRAQEASTVVENLDFPIAIAFSPDGTTMFVNERPGRILAFDERGRSRVVAEVPTTVEGETGLLGLAVSPRGDELYVFATVPDGSSNRVMRVPVSGGAPDTVVAGLPASVYHNGGGVAFDRAGMLLVSNGESHDSAAAQDPSVLGGKIYRFTTSGDAAAGNPFGDAIAIGLRNPFGMTIDPVSGDAFVTDNGPSSDDEINRITVGSNYGWPDLLGVAGDDAQPSGPGTYREPVSVQEDIVVPTGLAFADPSTARAGVAGDLFYGTYSEATVRRVVLDEERSSAVSDEIYLQESDPVIAMAWGPRGLYYSTPDAVKVIDLAREPATGGASPRRSPSRAARSPRTDPTGDENESFGVWIGLAVVAVAAGAAMLFIARR